MGPWVIGDASRPDPGDKRLGVAGTDARAGFNDDAEFDFRHRGTFAIRIVLEFPKLLFCRGRGRYPEAIFGRLFPTHRTLLQTAEIARQPKSAGKSFIRGARG